MAELWQGQAADSPLTMPADVEMSLPWSRSGALGIIDDWVVSGDFLPALDAILAAPPTST
ncbi:hypothetical protein [Gandjariella thermophila]|uniref:hypothetical protein n=1 Tax=Gandjariella thermophila TaxID=1931992 RepID=UPI0010F74D64|nr:hypothetical protein [Gandjariella thermophila]